MRVSGARQRNRRNASPENLVSAKNAGSPPSSRMTTAQGEKPASSTAKLEDGNRVLEQARGAHDQRQRAARGLAPRARQLVVELRVLEVRELERQRLLEDHHVHAMRELGLEQRLAQRDAAVRGRDDHEDRQRLGDHPPRRGMMSMCSAGHVRLAGRDHAVDDARADPGHARGQHAREDGQKPSNNDSGRSVSQSSSSARLLYLKTPKNWRAEFSDSPWSSGCLAMPGLALMGCEAYRETQVDTRQSPATSKTALACAASSPQAKHEDEHR